MAELPDDVWTLIVAKMAGTTPLAAVSRRFYAITVRSLELMLVGSKIVIKPRRQPDNPGMRRTKITGLPRDIRISVSYMYHHAHVWDVKMHGGKNKIYIDLRGNGQCRQTSVGSITFLDERCELQPESFVYCKELLDNLVISPLAFNYFISRECTLCDSYPRWIRVYAAEVRARATKFGADG